MLALSCLVVFPTTRVHHRGTLSLDTVDWTVVVTTFPRTILLYDRQLKLDLNTS